jgi:group I intron endonuclease
MKTAGTYQIICKENGKKYVGSSLNVKARLTGHRSYLRRNAHGNIHLQRAWNKYGENCFIFEPIELIDDADVEIIRKLEQDILDSYSGERWGLLFNIYPTVDMTVMAEETKAKLKGVNIGRIPSEETRKKLSISGKAAWQDPKRIADREAAINKPEVKAAMSKKLIERWKNHEKREKLIESQRKSGKGIKETRCGNYVATIWIDGKYIHLGTFTTKEKALEERLKAEKHYWTEGASIQEYSKLPKSYRKRGSGIYPTKDNKYLATIYANKKKIHLGTFDSYEKALKIRLEAEEYYLSDNYNANEDKYKPTSLRKSGKGVKLVKSGKYIAVIKVGGKPLHLGTFTTKEEALAARLEAEKLYWGESDAS